MLLLLVLERVTVVRIEQNRKMPQFKPKRFCRLRNSLKFVKFWIFSKRIKCLNGLEVLYLWKYFWKLCRLSWQQFTRNQKLSFINQLCAKLKGQWQSISHKTKVPFRRPRSDTIRLKCFVTFRADKKLFVVFVWWAVSPSIATKLYPRRHEWQIFLTSFVRGAPSNVEIIVN